jgi:hypothetical protein
MTQPLYKLDTRRAHPATEAARAAAEAGFKPLALPALAAAVETARATRPMRLRVHDLPAILRKEAAID